MRRAVRPVLRLLLFALVAATTLAAVAAQDRDPMLPAA